MFGDRSVERIVPYDVREQKKGQKQQKNGPNDAPWSYAARDSQDLTVKFTVFEKFLWFNRWKISKIKPKESPKGPFPGRLPSATKQLV